MKTFIANKGKGFWCSLLALLCSILGLIFFRMLTSVSFEQTEHPAVVIAFAFAAILFALIASYKDYGKVPSLAAYAASTAAFFTLVEGRVSYLAFYFSGDVMNTGLSPFMVLAFVCFLAAMVLSLLAVVGRQDREGKPAFEKADWKVLIPMAAAVAAVCAVVMFNTLSSGAVPAAEPVRAAVGTSVQPAETAAESTAAAPAQQAKYKSPTESEEKWQGYDGSAYLAEDVSGKAIAYQLTGHKEIEVPDPKPFDVLLNLYEDGEAVMTVYGMGRASNYYGYWNNVEDDHLWFGVTCYDMESQEGTRTIDYSYDLTGRFDSFTANIALGFADGGQFVREVPVGGDGSVQYSSVEAFLTEKGWTKPAAYKTPTEPEEKWQGYDGSAYLAEDMSGKAIAYQLTGHKEIEVPDPKPFDVLLNLYEDGEAVMTVYGMGRASHYYGYWNNVEDDHLWFGVTCYDMESQEGTCTIDYSYDLTGRFDTFTANIALGFANGGQFVREVPVGGDGSVQYSSVEAFLTEKGWTKPETADSAAQESAQTDGTAPAEEAASAEEAQPEAKPILFSFVSDSENYLLDIHPDGTYTFTFVTAGLVEEGTWTWKDWNFTLIDANGKVTESTKGEGYALCLHFEAAATPAVNRDFTCDATTWGTAFGGTGNYQPE